MEHLGAGKAYLSRFEPGQQSDPSHTCHPSVQRLEYKWTSRPGLCSKKHKSSDTLPNHSALPTQTPFGVLGTVLEDIETLKLVQRRVKRTIRGLETKIPFRQPL